jgi:hypothetical protein
VVRRHELTDQAGLAGPGQGGEIAESGRSLRGSLRHMVAAKGWRRIADRLPLTGVAVTGAVVGHTLAYAVAVPQPGARLVLLARTGHTYWSTAIAVAVVCGLASVVSSLIRQFRAGLLAARRPRERSLGRLAGRLAMRRRPPAPTAGTSAPADTTERQGATR